MARKPSPIHKNPLAWLIVLAMAAGAPTVAMAKEAKTSKASAGEPVTFVWCCTGPCDVYLNGKPLRDAQPDFMSRTDEGLDEYTAKAPLKVGDTITVGARRGKQCGFRMVVLDAVGRLVWQTDTANWRAYEISDPRIARRWYMPATLLHSRPKPVSIPSGEFPNLEQFEKPRANLADHIWYQQANVVLLACKVTVRRNLAPLPMKSMSKNGQVRWYVNDAQLDGLQPDDLIDGETRIKHFHGASMRYTLDFYSPTEVQGAMVSLAEPQGTFTWQIECADHHKDLLEKTGTYRIVTKQKSTSEQSGDVYWTPTKALYWQLTAHSSGGGKMIGLRKFELLAPPRQPEE